MKVSLLVGLVPLVVACFDLEHVDLSDHSGADAAPAPLLIDDFDHESPAPSSDMFGPWICSGWVTRQCAVSSPGLFSLHGLSIKFDLTDVPNGAPDYRQAGLRTWRSSATTLDARPFRNLVFSTKLVPDEQGLPNPEIDVRLSCSAGGEHADAITYIHASLFGVGRDWDSHALAISSFRSASEPNLPVDVGDCAAHVDGIGFYVLAAEPASTDGQKASGELTIDDVYLQ